MRRLQPAWARRDPWLWRLGLPVLLAAVLTGSFLAGGWALGRTLPLRSFNALHLVFLLGWFLTVFVWPRSDDPAPPGATPLLRLLGAGVLALGLLVAPNTKSALRDLGKGWAAHFDRQMEGRYAAAREASRDGTRARGAEGGLGGPKARLSPSRAGASPRQST